MRDVLRKACNYTPEAVVDFVLDLEKELDLENKALFRGIFVRYFLSDTLTYTDELKPKLSNKNETL